MIHSGFLICYSRVDRAGFVVPDGREHGDIREVIRHHLDAVSDDLKVPLPGSVPHGMRNQIPCPDDEVYVLQESEWFLNK